MLPGYSSDARFFDRRFLSAALIPVTAAATLLLVAVAVLLGIGTTRDWFRALSFAVRFGTLTTAVGLIVVVALFARSVRGPLLALWSRRFPGSHVNALGDALASIYSHPVERHLRPDLFWPALARVLGRNRSVHEKIRDACTGVDLYVLCATASLLISLTAVLVGPWIWWSVGVWATVAIVSGALAYVFYRRTLGAAEGLRGVIRDLARDERVWSEVENSFDDRTPPRVTLFNPLEEDPIRRRSGVQWLRSRDWRRRLVAIAAMLAVGSWMGSCIHRAARPRLRVVASHDIPRGRLLSRADVRFRVTRERAADVPRLREVVGMRTRDAMASGQSIVHDRLRPPARRPDRRPVTDSTSSATLSRGATPSPAATPTLAIPPIIQCPEPQPCPPVVVSVERGGRVDLAKLLFLKLAEHGARGGEDLAKRATDTAQHVVEAMGKEFGVKTINEVFKIGKLTDIDKLVEQSRRARDARRRYDADRARRPPASPLQMPWSPGTKMAGCPTTTATTIGPNTPTPLLSPRSPLPGATATPEASVVSRHIVVHFPFNRAEIEPTQLNRLHAFADEPMDDTCRVEVRGFTDRTGTGRYNLWLSWRRANVVAETLVSAGVDPWRIQVVPRGSEEAHAHIHRGKGDPHDRRAEARITCPAAP